MKHIEYKTEPFVCAKLISFDLDDNNRISNLSFKGGCNGNLKAISILVDGQDANKIITLLKGNTCGPRPTSCADQLAKALLQALKQC